MTDFPVKLNTAIGGDSSSTRKHTKALLRFSFSVPFEFMFLVQFDAKYKQRSRSNMLTQAVVSGVDVQKEAEHR